MDQSLEWAAGTDEERAEKEWEARTSYEIGVLMDRYLQDHPPPRENEIHWCFRDWAARLRVDGAARLAALGASRLEPLAEDPPAET